MKTKTLLLFAFTATLAFGATAWTYRHNVKVAGSTILGTQVETNFITRSVAGSFDFDFAVETIECEDTPAITMTGAVVGDACHVGIPVLDTSDGGNGLNRVYDCYVSATDAVKIRSCAIGTADDPPDAGYTFRLFSVQ